MATVDVTSQPIVVEATADTSVVAFTETDVTVEVANPQPVVEFSSSATLVPGTGLVGGGYMLGNVPIALSAAAIASLAKADSAVQPGNNLSAFVNDLNLSTNQNVTDSIAALNTVYQPLNSNLTAVAAMATTVFGRSFLELADAAASRTLMGVYSTSQVYTKSEVDAIFAVSLIPVWGTITGSILDQADLQMALSARSSIGHLHDASVLTTGIVAPARLGSGVPDNTKFLRGDSSWVVLTADHGGLTGLVDDDHTQYHTDARGDIRYNTKAEITTLLSGKVNAAGGTFTSNPYIENNDPILWLKDNDDPSATTRYGFIYKQDGNLQLGMYNAAIDTVAAYMNLSTGGLSVNGTAVAMAGHTHAYLSDAPSDGSQYARKNGAWDVVTAGGATFNGGVITGDLQIENTQPNFWMRETDASADNKVWRFVASGQNFYCQIYNDAISAGTTVFTLSRSGITPGTVNFTSPLLLDSLLTVRGDTQVGYATNGHLFYESGLSQSLYNVDSTASAMHEWQIVEGTATRAIYVRFHQANRWYWRLKANANGFSVVAGAADTYTNFYAGCFIGGGATSLLPALGNRDSATSLWLSYAGDPTYGLLAGVLGSGKGWIQVGRTDGVATAYDLQLQPLGGNIEIGTAALVVSPTGDANTMWTDGYGYVRFARYATGTVNVPEAPDNANFLVSYESHVGGYGRQFAYPDNQNLWTRLHSAGTWGTWHKIARHEAGTYIRADYYDSWSGSGWARAISLRPSVGSCAIQFWDNGGTPRHWGVGQSGGIFYIMHTSSDASGGAGMTYPFYINATQVNIDRALNCAASISVASGYGVYFNGYIGTNYMADRASNSYGTVRFGGSKNSWAGIFFDSAYGGNGLMFSTGNNSWGLYSESNGWSIYYEGTRLFIQGSTKAVVYMDFATSGSKITRGTAAPSGGSDGDIYFQYT